MVIRAYQLAASGSTDWEVAAQTGLAKTHVSEVLTNPIYAGRLRTGEPAAIAPIVDPSLWSTVQTRRERRRTRTPGRIVKGRYALRLCCAGCGKYLFGDVGRYRHPPPTCEGFLAAKPVVRCRRARNRDGIDTASRATATRRSGTRTPSVSSRQGRRTRRAGHDRGRAPLRRGTREARRAHAGPHRAGAGGGVCSASRRPETSPPGRRRWRGSTPSSRWPASHASSSAWRPTRSSPTCARCPSLWNDAGPEGRQALASALFTKLEVEGYTKMRYELTPDAVTLGLGAALPAQTETGGHTGGFGRGERGSASLTHLRFRPRFVLENVDSGGEIVARCVPEGRLMAKQRPTRRQLEVLRAYIRAGSVAAAALRARHRRDDGPATPVGAVPADRLRERGAGGVLAGQRATRQWTTIPVAVSARCRAGTTARGSVSGAEGRPSGLMWPWTPPGFE